jgi:hypothetical protein
MLTLRRNGMIIFTEGTNMSRYPRSAGRIPLDGSGEKEKAKHRVIPLFLEV